LKDTDNNNKDSTGFISLTKFTNSFEIAGKVLSFIFKSSGQ